MHWENSCTIAIPDDLWMANTQTIHYTNSFILYTFIHDSHAVMVRYLIRKSCVYVHAYTFITTPLSDHNMHHSITRSDVEHDFIAYRIAYKTRGQKQSRDFRA